MNDVQPLVTFALLAYNQERYIIEAVEGALRQTYSPLQIILSDDYSSDCTFALMQEATSRYLGPHQLTVRCNDRNLGLGAHINCIMELAKGQLIVGAAGDDVSLPHRTERLWSEYQASGGKALSIFSNECLIDEFGNRIALGMRKPPSPETLTLEWFAKRQSSVSGSSHAWHRSTFDVFGPLGAGVVSEDAAIPFRSLLLGCIRYIDEPLVLRRYTGENISLGALQWWDSRTSVSRFYSTTLDHARNFTSVYETRIKDIDRFVHCCPEQGQQLRALQSVTELKLQLTKSEQRFWEASTREKLQTLISDFLKKGAWRTALRLAASWLHPNLYLRLNHILSMCRRGKITGGCRELHDDTTKIASNL